jgi:ABC-type thiamin/hydroxymethylpyrimidine transport system permease subunit
MQAVPRWTHPSLLLDWDPSIYYGIIGVSGAGTGFIVAQYRYPGLLAGALAGTGSVLTASLILERINPFSRIVLAMVGIIGLLPGVAFYGVLHLVIDRLRVKLPDQAETF